MSILRETIKVLCYLFLIWFYIAVISHHYETKTPKVVKEEPYKDSNRPFNERIVSIHYSYKSYCSGFKLTNNIVTTAAHCIKPRIKMYNVFNDITGIDVYKLHKYSYKNDVAILVKSGVTQNEFKYAKSLIKLDCSGDKAISYGYPGKKKGLFASEGVMNGYYAFNYNTKAYLITGKMYHFSGKVYGGMSGGPVFSSDYKLCGVNSGAFKAPKKILEARQYKIERVNRFYHEAIKNPGFITKGQPLIDLME